MLAKPCFDRAKDEEGQFFPEITVLLTFQGIWVVFLTKYRRLIAPLIKINSQQTKCYWSWRSLTTGVEKPTAQGMSTKAAKKVERSPLSTIFLAGTSLGARERKPSSTWLPGDKSASFHFRHLWFFWGWLFWGPLHIHRYTTSRFD